MTLKPVSLSEQIARHLAEQIITGKREPGERLPESELARELDVSTNSLREAFRLLEKQHLIDLQPRRGASVCDVTDQQVRDLYDFLFLLLSNLAGRTAKYWQPGEIEDLVQMLPMLEEHYANDDILSAHKVAFQLVEVATDRFAHNRYLAADIRDLLPLLQRYSYIALVNETTEFHESLKSFRDLMTNVLARDEAAAAADIRAYGDNQCKIVLEAIHKHRRSLEP